MLVSELSGRIDLDKIAVRGLILKNFNNIDNLIVRMNEKNVIIKPICHSFTDEGMITHALLVTDVYTNSTSGIMELILKNGTYPVNGEFTGVVDLMSTWSKEFLKEYVFIPPIQDMIFDLVENNLNLIQ